MDSDLALMTSGKISNPENVNDTVNGYFVVLKEIEDKFKLEKYEFEREKTAFQSQKDSYERKGIVLQAARHRQTERTDLFNKEKVELRDHERILDEEKRKKTKNEQDRDLLKEKLTSKKLENISAEKEYMTTVEQEESEKLAMKLSSKESEVRSLNEKRELYAKRKIAFDMWKDDTSARVSALMEEVTAVVNRCASSRQMFRKSSVASMSRTLSGSRLPPGFLDASFSRRGYGSVPSPSSRGSAGYASYSSINSEAFVLRVLRLNFSLLNHKKDTGEIGLNSGDKEVVVVKPAPSILNTVFPSLLIEGRVAGRLVISVPEQRLDGSGGASWTLPSASFKFALQYGT